MQSVATAINQRSEGVGWVLTIIEFMRSEWGCSLRQAMWKESLTAAVELWPAMLARHGVEPRSDYADRARRRAKEEARRWINENFVVEPSKKGSRYALAKHPESCPAGAT